MKVVPSYFVKRNGKSIWLAIGLTPETDDVVVEERMMAVASEGKTLSLNGEIVGESSWVKNPENMELIEVNKPTEEEEGQSNADEELHD